MEAKEILTYCLANLSDTVLVESWGEKGIFLNPGGVRKRGIYLLTIKEKDGAHDCASALSRPGVYRVNLGVGKERFRALFDEVPHRPPAGGVVAMDYDFTACDRILPHPVYAWMGWICVLNPSRRTFLSLWPEIERAASLAQKRFERERRRKEGTDGEG